MHEEVKKYAENHDIKGLRYILLDSLDVDPTFEKYKEDYAYCQKVSGVFESHRELMPLKSNQTQWDDSYWEKLKMDLMENFSEKRFAHMIQVAKVVYADKISRILEERKAEERKRQESNAKGQKEQGVAGSPRVIISEDGQQSPKNPSQGSTWNAIRQEQELEKKRKEIELENQRIEAEQRRQRERIAAKKAEYTKQSSTQGDHGIKKIMGIGLAAAVVLIIILIKIL